MAMGTWSAVQLPGFLRRHVGNRYEKWTTEGTATLADDIKHSETEKQFIREVIVRQDAAELIAAFFLELDLIVQAEPPADMPSALAEQRRTIKMLRALFKFIEQSWGNSRRIAVQRYLLKLEAQFAQLNDGVTHPHMMARRLGKSGHKPDTLENWEARRWACAAFECFVRSGKYTREKAAEYIAKQPANRPLRRLVRNATEDLVSRIGPDDLRDAILSWHQGFQQRKNKSKTVQSMWTSTLEIISRNQDTNTPEIWLAQGEVCLVKARDAASSVGLNPKGVFAD
jgi:hypothetical protein